MIPWSLPSNVCGAIIQPRIEYGEFAHSGCREYLVAQHSHVKAGYTTWIFQFKNVLEVKDSQI